MIFAAAAVLEVGGDALVREGLLRSGFWVIAPGFAALGSYGIG
jgi:hypothetical protein